VTPNLQLHTPSTWGLLRAHRTLFLSPWVVCLDVDTLGLCVDHKLLLCALPTFKKFCLRALAYT
jgi:hypothetical protein